MGAYIYSPANVPSRHGSAFSCLTILRGVQGDASMVQANLEQLRAVRSRTLTLMQDLSQGQLNYVPEPGAWSIGEMVDHLILSEQVLRRDMAVLIEQAKAGQTPYLYRSFAEFNARPAFIPECALSWLEAPLNVFNMFMPASMREYIIRNVPVRAL